MERLRATASSLFGPALIVAGVLVVLWRFAFGGLISAQHPDLLPLWLPTGCFLGRSLAAGHIPAWNPHVMGGLPFAADPQSGWMAVVPMAVFTALPCQLAIRWFLVAQPIIAGLGLYAFCRSEGVSRAGATLAGVVASLMLSASLLVLNPAISAPLAWTAVLLAAASRLMRARTWPSRLAWILLTAVAWGQLAASHLSEGLVIGSVIVVPFIVAAGVREVRTGRLRSADLAIVVAVLVVALPLVNLAYLWPRLVYLPRTSLHLGYARLEAVSRSLGSNPGTSGPAETGTLDPIFPLRLGAAPGLYAGVAALLLSFAGWWSKRHRPLTLAFSIAGGLCYVASLGVVAHAVRRLMGGNVLVQFYLHSPGRFVFGLVIVVPVLAAAGLDAWREAESRRTKIVMILPGLFVWGAIPFLLGLHRTHPLLPLAGLVLAAAVFAASTARPAAVLLVPVLLAGELGVNGLTGQSIGPAADPANANAAPRRLSGYAPLERPTLCVGCYATPDFDPIVLALKKRSVGRYLSLAPNFWTPLGYNIDQSGPLAGLMGLQQSMLFGLREAQGYNSVQPLRYWEFVRAADPKPIRYNAAGFISLSPVILNLLQVGSIIQPVTDAPALRGAFEVANEGDWRLNAVPDPVPAASLVTSWTVVSSSVAALHAVVAPLFDPNATAVLEQNPGLRLTSAVSGGSVRYVAEGPQAARVDVEASVPSILLIRNVYDPRWTATVDGRSAPILPADFLVQGIPVPAGRHTVDLAYRDPSIGFGLLGSALSVATLLGAALFTRSRRRRRAAAPATAA